MVINAGTVSEMDWAPLPSFEVDTRSEIPLGREVADGHRQRWSSSEDSVGIVGPPRYGKTSGLIIPAVMHWAGPVLCTSTRGDILDFTGDRRRAVAAEAGGAVHVYDPFDSTGRTATMGWSPLAGCDDPAVCYRRIAALSAAAGTNILDGDHWRAGAASVLRPYFHAAALAGLSMTMVRQWLGRQEMVEPLEILRGAGGPGMLWADDLDAVAGIGHRERGGFYSVARNVLEATSEPTVLASCDAADFDVDAFLASRSTLYLVGPSHHQAAVAPLIAALVDSVVHRALELAARQGGRLDQPLLLALDEVANIAPIASLPALVSEGGGRGILTMWAAQSLAQIRRRYGADTQAAILTATSAKIIYGGLSNGHDLSDIASWTGDAGSAPLGYAAAVAPPPPADHAFGFAEPTGPGRGGDAGPHTLSVNAIQMMPPFNAWLFYRSDPPVRVETRPAGLIEQYEKLSGNTAVDPAPAARSAPPARRVGVSFTPAPVAAAPVDVDFPWLDATAALAHDGAAPRFDDVDLFVAGIAQLLERRPNPSAVHWCARWWAHPEAMSRIYALWLAWEELRFGTGPSDWWSHHLDRHLWVLTGHDGPFARCRPDEHRPAVPYPAEPAPAALGAGLPGLPPAPPSDDAVPPVFATLDAFLTGYLFQVLERRGGGGFTWCARWWAHPEATARFHALWQAWEHSRAYEGRTGISLWWRDHVDFHLATLLDPAGPFANCGPGAHREPARLPLLPVPAEVLAELARGSEEREEPEEPADTDGPHDPDPAETGSGSAETG